MFNKKKKEESPVPAAAVSAAPAPAAASSPEISAEIIAVITAAIAAMTGGNAAGLDGFIVRKISRVHGEKVTWSNVGLMECIDSRKI